MLGSHPLHRTSFGQYQLYRPHQQHQHGQEIGTGNLVDKMHASNKMFIKFLLMEGNEYKCWCQCLT